MCDALVRVYCPFLMGYSNEHISVEIYKPSLLEIPPLTGWVA
jgi:hypothetical protein